MKDTTTIFNEDKYTESNTEQETLMAGQDSVQLLISKLLEYLMHLNQLQ